jgi:PAT family beta-lactamase induction signal transducer AmpG
MGFGSGLPLLLTISLLQAWMKESGVNLTTIGIMALVGLPYTLKFLWAPLFDRFTLPFLGRRKGWLIVAQLLLAGSIVLMGQSDPLHNPWMVAFFALLVTFFSASQDIVIDAYRREDLLDDELGFGSSLYVTGYRLGMLLVSGGGLILADFIGFPLVYKIVAGLMLIPIIVTLTTPEPRLTARTPSNFKEAVIDPLVDYFQRKEALWILLFILLYKVGDTMASSMTTPFYLSIGYTKTEIGAIVKLFGTWATILGGLIGGIMMVRLGIVKSLWIFGILQAVSTFGFSMLAALSSSFAASHINQPAQALFNSAQLYLTIVITVENITGGMGTTAYAAFMASITNKKFTATQYALLSSLMGVPRVILSAPTGFMAHNMGWFSYFLFCTIIAIPGMLLLLKLGAAPKDSTSS